MRIDWQDAGDEPEIGLIALIDCIFFLLMFFMVATSFKQQEGQRLAKELPINLPQAEAALRDLDRAGPAALVIGLDARGQLYLDGAAVSVQALHDGLRTAAQRRPVPPVRLEGDRSVPLQQVVHVLDLCAFEGLTQVSVRTRAK